MDKQSAVKLIRETFENPFDKVRFTNLCKNLLKHLDESNSFFWGGNRLPNAGAFQTYINSIERIGKYQDADGNKMDVLIVRLKKEQSLEYARTMQRNFVARYLDGFMNSEQKNAALVASFPDKIPGERDETKRLYSGASQDLFQEGPGEGRAGFSPRQKGI